MADPSANSNQIRCDFALFEDTCHPGLHALLGRYYLPNQNRSQLGIEILCSCYYHPGLHALLDKLALACRAFRRRARNSLFKGQASLYLNGSIPFSVQVHYPISKLQTINHGGQRGHKTSNHNHYRPITADPSK